MSTTPVANLPLASLKNTGGKFATGGRYLPSVFDTSGKLLPISLTQGINLPLVSMTQVGTYATTERICSTAACNAPGRIYSSAACAVPGRVFPIAT